MRFLSAILTAAALAGLTAIPAVQAQSSPGAMRMVRPGAEMDAAPAARASGLAVAAPPADLPREPLAAPGGGSKVRLPSNLRAAVTRDAGHGAVHECVQGGAARE
ncbi:MAG: hypothetical protein SF182_27380 [Deltaproteobacteria bacterium]|nr:hypothetical protein [Deltaproteobacteria bacterium]